MKTRDHFKLAKSLVMDNNEGKKSFYGYCFILGNVLPDINVFTHISGLSMAGHTYEESYDSIKKKMKKILKKDTWNAKDAYEFGKALHYITDYFTHAHNMDFEGGLAEHNSYEKSLRKVFSIHLNYDLSAKEDNDYYPISRKKVFNYIELKHKEYKENWLSMEDDCSYIFKICTCLMCLYYTNVKPRISPSFT